MPNYFLSAPATVAYAGAVGALIAIAVLDVTGVSSLDTDFLRVVLVAPVGAFASLVFVYLIAHTDRTDWVRLHVLALVGGFFWEPVIAAAGLYVDDTGQKVAAQNISEGLREISELRAEVGDKPIDANTQRAIQDAVSEITMNAQWVEKPQYWKLISADFPIVAQSVTGSEMNPFDEYLTSQGLDSALTLRKTAKPELQWWSSDDLNMK